MKKKLLTFAFLVISASIFSTATFAQTAPGDDGSGTAIPPEGGGTVPSTYSYKSFTFKRNNGNGYGVCGMSAQVRVVFDPMPATVADIPKLTSILYKGQELLGNTVVVSYTSIVNHTQPYVSYCLTSTLPDPGSSDGNIPPAEKLTLQLRNQ